VRLVFTNNLFRRDPLPETRAPVTAALTRLDAMRSFNSNALFDIR
jgi:hypothetical protein